MRLCVTIIFISEFDGDASWLTRTAIWWFGSILQSLANVNYVVGVQDVDVVATCL